MQTPKQIRDIADLRLKEAETLFQASLYDGAFYLAGYAVELYFKARICTLLQVDDFYVGSDIKSVPFLSKAYQTHNLDALMLLSGLRSIYDAEKTHNLQLMEAWSGIQKSKWSEQLRYAAPQSCDDCTAEEFINSSKFFTQWIAKH